MQFSAVIVAAGQGLRAGGGLAKQWRDLGGKPVVRWSAEALVKAGAQEVVVVVLPKDRARAEAALGGLSGWRLAAGGATRARSVLSGLKALQPVEAVLIHDAARPFIPDGLVPKLLEALKGAHGAIPALPIADSLKRSLPSGTEPAPREGLWQAQTPQAFPYAAIMEAYDDVEHRSLITTDDAAVVENRGGRVVIVQGDPMLMKLTYREDFAMAQALAAARRTMRAGSGFDAHRFGPGTEIWLCGLKVAHDQGLVGHSDADVGLHALTDALLGAIGAGDIGEHFPASDPRWKDASSETFVRHALELIAQRGGRVTGVDITLICEAPKIGPHREAMRTRLADILGLGLDQVSVKATTTEGMGFTGRGEGLAAQALATVDMPA